MRTWILGQFPTEKTLLAAARDARDRGLAPLEAFTPFPSPEAQAIVGPPSRLPALVLLGGLIGVGVGVAIQWFCNAYDYPIIVGGRPLLSLPAYVPISFECMVLFASLTALIGMMMLCELPEPYHPFFRADFFRRASIDRFILAIGLEGREVPPGLLSRLRDLGAEEIAQIEP